MTYKEYMNSDLWKKISMYAKLRDGEKCRCCSETNNLQVHHTSYPKTWAEDHPDNLLTLCQKHHERRHGIDHSKPVHISIVLKRVIRRIQAVYEGATI